MTRKQKTLLDYIRAYIEKNGVAPCFDEMRDFMGIASKSGIHRMIDSLEIKGHITRKPSCARSIRLADPMAFIKARGLESAYDAWRSS